MSRNLDAHDVYGGLKVNADRKYIVCENVRECVCLVQFYETIEISALTTDAKGR